MVTQDQTPVIEFLGASSTHNGARVERIDTPDGTQCASLRPPRQDRCRSPTRSCGPLRTRPRESHPRIVRTRSDDPLWASRAACPSGSSTALSAPPTTSVRHSFRGGDRSAAPARHVSGRRRRASGSAWATRHAVPGVRSKLRLERYVLSGSVGMPAASAAKGIATRMPMLSSGRTREGNRCRGRSSPWIAGPDDEVLLVG